MTPDRMPHARRPATADRCLLREMPSPSPTATAAATAGRRRTAREDAVAVRRPGPTTPLRLLAPSCWHSRWALGDEGAAARKSVRAPHEPDRQQEGHCEDHRAAQERDLCSRAGDEAIVVPPEGGSRAHVAHHDGHLSPLAPGFHGLQVVGVIASEVPSLALPRLQALARPGPRRMVPGDDAAAALEVGGEPITSIRKASLGDAVSVRPDLRG